MKRMGSLFSLLIISLIISACTTVPVMPAWPAVPAELREPCPPLRLWNTQPLALADLLEVVTNNYAQYHACAAQNSAWREWYDAQQRIWNTVRP